MRRFPIGKVCNTQQMWRVFRHNGLSSFVFLNSVVSLCIRILLNKRRYKGLAMQRRLKHSIVSMLLGSAMMLSACSEGIRKSGYYPLEQELAAVSIGQSTRAEVLEAMGSPTIQSDSAGPLYYVGQRTRYFGPFAPQIVDRQVVVVTFDSRGKVANVQTLGLEDGAVVVLSQRVTEPVAGDVSFYRQLFGNIGRVDASQLIGN